MIADIGLSRPALEERLALRRLRELLGDADATQHTGEPVADAHHNSNVMFNAMRGGVPIDGHRIDGRQVAAHLAERNRQVHDWEVPESSPGMAAPRALTCHDHSGRT